MSEMIPTEQPSPEQVLSPDDPGDDTLRRYRYQITYAAILSIHMIRDGSTTVELFCEHHEDILLKNDTGKFTGCQIKTKHLDLGPFTIDDEAIKKSCARFVKLDLGYPGEFIAFNIISNTGFASHPPAKCIKTFIDTIKSTPVEDLLKKRDASGKFIKALAEQCSCPPEKVISALSKMEIRTYSSLEDIQMKLMSILRDCPLLKGSSESKLQEIADLLLAKFLKASSLDAKDSSAFAYIEGKDTKEEHVRSVIEGKRVSKTGLMSFLAEQKEEPVKLLLKDRGSIAGLPKGAGKLTIKMDAGGIEADSIQLMRDFKYSFESLMTSWLYKEPDTADLKYSQIIGIIENICREEYEKHTVGSEEYGLPLLVDIRSRIQHRLEKDHGIFFACNYEHLLGVVAMLTEDCKVWWSKKFAISNA